MLHLDDEAKNPYYKQIYDQIKQEILTGLLPGGSKLPSTRTLAREIQAGRNTVESAYAQLVLEGYVVAFPGSGYVVTSIQPDMHAETPGLPEDGTEGSSRKKAESEQYAYNFDYGTLGPWAFPYKTWRNLTTDVLTEAEEMHFRDPAPQPRDAMQGDRDLRRELAKHLYRRRDVKCTADQIVICNGLQPALSSLLRVFPSQWHTVALENPGYRRARVVFQTNGLRLCPIPVLEDGIDVAALAESPARAVFVTPSRQYPTGSVLSIQKRMELLQWAADCRGLIIEDDYDSEYRYKGKPVPSLQSIDHSGRVVYLGSFSKVLSPGLRMGYMVLPEGLLESYRYAFAGYKCSVSWLEQKVLARFMAEGHMEKHIRKMCLLNKKKHDTLIEAITDAFGDTVRIRGQNAGLHLLLEFSDEENETALVEKAAERGVKVYPGSPLWIENGEKKPPSILLGYGTLPDDTIPEAIALLCDAWGLGKKKSGRKLPGYKSPDGKTSDGKSSTGQTGSQT